MARNKKQYKMSNENLSKKEYEKLKNLFYNKENSLKSIESRRNKIEISLFLIVLVVGVGAGVFLSFISELLVSDLILNVIGKNITAIKNSIANSLLISTSLGMFIGFIVSYISIKYDIKKKKLKKEEENIRNGSNSRT